MPVRLARAPPPHAQHSTMLMLTLLPLGVQAPDEPAFPAPMQLGHACRSQLSRGEHAAGLAISAHLSHAAPMHIAWRSLPEGYAWGRARPPLHKCATDNIRTQTPFRSLGRHSHMGHAHHQITIAGARSSATAARAATPPTASAPPTPCTDPPLPGCIQVHWSAAAPPLSPHLLAARLPPVPSTRSLRRRGPAVRGLALPGALVPA